MTNIKIVLNNYFLKLLYDSPQLPLYSIKYQQTQYNRTYKASKSAIS